MKLRDHGGLATLLIISAVSASGCQQKMAYQGRLRPYASSTKYSPVDGTVARGQLRQETSPALSLQLLKRGRERFEIHCAPCHGATGDGQGMIVQRGFLAPPTYHQDRLRKETAAHFFDVITQGYGAMYGYGDRVPVSDRWAIIAYIRALQLSQNAQVASLMPEDRKKLEGSGP